MKARPKRDGDAASVWQKRSRSADPEQSELLLNTSEGVADIAAMTGAYKPLSFTTLIQLRKTFNFPTLSGVL